MSKVIRGEFSKISGSKVRTMYSEDGRVLGTITKLDDGGYRVFRLKDKKIRTKTFLADAYRTIARAN